MKPRKLLTYCYPRLNRDKPWTNISYETKKPQILFSKTRHSFIILAHFTGKLPRGTFWETKNRIIWGKFPNCGPPHKLPLVTKSWHILSKALKKFSFDSLLALYGPFTGSLPTFYWLSTENLLIFIDSLLTLFWFYTDFLPTINCLLITLFWLLLTLYWLLLTLYWPLLNLYWCLLTFCWLLLTINDFYLLSTYSLLTSTDSLLTSTDSLLTLYWLLPTLYWRLLTIYWCLLTL